MVRLLLRWLLLVALGLAIAEPLHAQVFFLDLDGDGVCNFMDIPTSSAVDTFDVWIDTLKNLDGSPAVCGTGEDLSITSYEIVLRTDTGTTILSWTNSRPEFTVEDHKTIQAGASWLAYSAPIGSTHLAPGKYLLGRAGYQHTAGCPYIVVVPDDVRVPGAESKFGSHCQGSQEDWLMRLGPDFDGSCGFAVACHGIQPTTWGSIKSMYR